MGNALLAQSRYALLHACHYVAAECAYGEPAARRQVAGGVAGPRRAKGTYRLQPDGPHSWGLAAWP